MIMKITVALRRTARNRRGFTLVELMAVLAVLAIIAAIAVPRFTGTINTAKEKADKASAEIIAKAAEQYYIDHDESGTKKYTIYKDSNGNTTGDLKYYLKEAPEVQNYDDAAGYIAEVEDGVCTSVKYCNESGTEISGSPDLLK